MLEFEGELSLGNCFDGEMDDIHMTDKSGCVRYDIAQDLTEEQKALARENIGVVGDKHFKFDQNELSDTWLIEHNLDKYPSVIVEDTAHDQVFGSVQYISRNVIKIIFSSPIRGTAFLN